MKPETPGNKAGMHDAPRCSTMLHDAPQCSTMSTGARPSLHKLRYNRKEHITSTLCFNNAAASLSYVLTSLNIAVAM